MVVIAVLCVPWMLLMKPFYLRHKHKATEDEVSQRFVGLLMLLSFLPSTCIPSPMQFRNEHWVFMAELKLHKPLDHLFYVQCNELLMLWRDVYGCENKEDINCLCSKWYDQRFSSINILLNTDWQHLQGFQRLRSNTPSPPPVTVLVGEPGHNSHEVVHHDGQAQGEPHDDVHEEVRLLLVLLLFNQAQCDKI